VSTTDNKSISNIQMGRNRPQFTRRRTSGAFVLLAISLALDLAVTFIATDESFGSDILAGIAVYGPYVVACLFTAYRLHHGKGGVIGTVTLILILIRGLAVLIVVCALGVSGYHPPIYVWLSHAMIGVSYIGAWCGLIGAMWRSE